MVVTARTRPWRGARWRWSGVDLTTINGIGVTMAQVILTEVGPNLAVFPREKDFGSWLQLWPRTVISGGRLLPTYPHLLGRVSFKPGKKDGA